MHSRPYKDKMPKRVRLNRNTILLIFGLVVLLLIIYSFSRSGQSSLKNQSELVEMRELLSVSIELARRGGDAVREVRLNPLEKSMDEQVKSKTKEGANEFVTLGDLKSHRAMRAGFEKAFPGIKVISEEHDSEPIDVKGVAEPRRELKEELSHVKGSEEVPLSDITVWIDPLDATQEYTENLTQYVTTMVCVAIKGVPTIGVVHKPFESTTSWAWVNNGLSPDLLRLNNLNARTDSYKVIVSRSHAGSVEKALSDSFQDKAKAIPAGGAGYKVLELLKGNADVYLHITNIKKWDVCAGAALIRATHGLITTLREGGKKIDFSGGGSVLIEGGLLAAGGGQYSAEIHKTFLKHMKL